MREGLPPQRRPGGSPGGPGARGTPANLSAREGVEQAAKRLGLPCFHVGQKVPGLFGCVACQFQIRNRGKLPTCPECGEIVWAYLEEGPPPVPEGEEEGAPPPQAAGPRVEEGVKLDAPTPPAHVEENVKLEP